MAKTSSLSLSLLLFVLLVILELSLQAPRAKAASKSTKQLKRAFDAAWENKDIPSESDRLLSQVETFFEREVRFYQQCGLGNQTLTLVDLGCGPGHLSAKFLSLFPSLNITCVDIDTRLQDEGKKLYSHFTNSSRLTYVKGTASNTTLPSFSYDIVVVRLLFQHLSNRQRRDSLHEIRRILKKGGKVIVTDADSAHSDILVPDWDGWALLEPKRIRMKKKLGIAHSDADFGRKVWPLLEDEGFVNISADAIYMHTKDFSDLKHFIILNHPSMFLPVVKSGFIRKSQYDSVVKGFEEYVGSQPPPYMISCLMSFCGTKSEIIGHTTHDEL